jgi:hypothetical protein
MHKEGMLISKDFTEAFGDIFDNPAVVHKQANAEAADDGQRHEGARMSIKVAAWEIANGQVEGLVGYIETLFLNHQEWLERQRAEEVDLLIGLKNRIDARETLLNEMLGDLRSRRGHRKVTPNKAAARKRRFGGMAV